MQWYFVNMATKQPCVSSHRVRKLLWRREKLRKIFQNNIFMSLGAKTNIMEQWREH